MERGEASKTIDNMRRAHEAEINHARAISAEDQEKKLRREFVSNI